jgi:hypothetical protein
MVTYQGLRYELVRVERRSYNRGPVREYATLKTTTGRQICVPADKVKR